jgi:choline kinase
MLDINGKSLIKRDVESLNAVGIDDIRVIVGHKKESMVVENVSRIENPDYSSKGILHSVSLGAANPGEKNVIAYSDILFDPEIIEGLLKKNDDVMLVVDSSYKKVHVRNKKLELVSVENPRVSGIRAVNMSRTKRILKIGRELSEADAHYEFVGLACLTRKGVHLLAREYETALKKCARNKAKLKALEQISFADFIQVLIDKGHPVHAYEVSGGWMEVHNFSDYKHACSIFT